MNERPQTSKDATDTPDLAQVVSGCDQATVVHEPRLLSDNGSSYVGAELAEYPSNKGMDHVRGAPHSSNCKARLSAGIKP